MPLATLVTMWSALPLLGGLIRGDQWWVPAAVLMTVAALASALYRWWLRDSLAVPFLQSFAVLLLYTPLFAPQTAVVGIFPTLDTLDHTLALFEQGVHTIDTNAPPVSPTPGLGMIIALVFVVFLMTADFLAVTARCPGMVGGLLLALMLVPLVVDEAGLGWGRAAICAFGFLALLAVDMWVRGREWGVPIPSGHGPESRAGAVFGRVGIAAASSVLAITLALLLPLSMPSLSSDAVFTKAENTQFGSNGSVTTTHPMVSLRRDLTSASDRTVLTYRTDEENPEYLRTFVLDEFDGEDWTMTPVHAGRDNNADEALPLPAGREGEPPEEEIVTTRVSMDSDTVPMDFLPLPYPARSVEIAGDWYVDESTLMVFTTEAPPSGYNFVVRSARNRPSAQTLALAGSPRSLTDDQLHLPRELDARVQELTDSLVEGTETDYERALALQNFFTDGDFTYDLNPPPVPENADPLTHFLFEDRIGYCQQYASAMAVMARQAGIPARVAVGYTSGRPSGDDRWTVSVRDAHAWPELYFEGSGWMRFEPTPADPNSGQGSASPPDYGSGSTEPPDDEGSEPEPSPTSEAGDSPREPSPDPEDDESAPEEGPTAAGTDEISSSDGASPVWAPIVGIGIAVSALMATPALGRMFLRWSRRSTMAAGGATAAHAAWRELHDTCLDLGMSWDLAESPRATAKRLASLSVADGGEPTEVARGALWRLALAEENARYAPEPQGGQELGGDLDAAQRALLAAASPGRRSRALLLPPSLAPWRRSRAESKPLPTVF